jgi:hypothetical protein
MLELLEAIRDKAMLAQPFAEDNRVIDDLKEIETVARAAIKKAKGE